MNRVYYIFAYFEKKYFYYALTKLKEVFLSKTLTFFVYSSIPLIVTANYGNNISSMYILGERIKSLYTTLFQPFIQIFYLSQFQIKNTNTKKKVITSLLFIFNFLILLSCLMIISDINYLNDILARFIDLNNKEVYIFASFIAVNSSIILYFKILPEKSFMIFRQSAYLQTFTFLTIFLLISINIYIPPSYILLTGEITLFLSMIYKLITKELL
jgi:hypothetical protein